MDHPLNQASLDGLDEMDQILKGMAELDGDTSPHADASLEALRRGEKSLKEVGMEGMDENVEKLIQAARNAREQKPNTEVTVEGQVSELVEAANEKLQRATKNSVRDALRTYDEVLASGAQGEYLVPLLVNRAIALDALGECSAAAESVRLAMDALPPESEKRQELQRLRDEFDAAALEKPTDVPTHEGDAAAMLNALNAPPEPAEGGAPFPPPPPPSKIPFHKHVRRGPPLKFSESDRNEACSSKDAGNLHLREGNVPDAIVEYGNAIKKDPDDAILWSNRAVAYLQLSQDNDTTAAQAAADALRAVTCDPNWPRGYCTLGDALLRLGSPLEALEAYLDGARVARDAGRLEDAFELDRKGRDARDAVIMRRPFAPRRRRHKHTTAQAQKETERLRDQLKSGVKTAEPARTKSVTSRLAYRACAEAPRDRSIFTRLAQGTSVEVYESHGLGLRLTKDVQQGEVLLQEKALCVISLRDDACLMCAAKLEREQSFCCGACGTLFERRVKGASKRFRAHRRSLEAEGCVVGAGFHSIAAAQLFGVDGEDLSVLEALRRPGDLAERPLVPFSDRHALIQDIDELRHGPDDAGDYVRRRRLTASIDFGRVDALAGALEMNNLIVRGGEAVVIPRLACLANHDSTPSCEIWLGDQRQVDVVAVRDLKAGDEVTLDYCACSATVDHRRMVLGPFGLAHLAVVELVEDVEEEFPDYVPENRRRVDPAPPGPPPGPPGE